MKYPWMQFFATDWLNDPLVSICEPATRGILMDWLCNMHLLDRSGLITATREQLARLGRCTTVQVESALTDLIQTKAADVTFRNDVVTVVNRRMKREYLARKNGAIRVERHRRNGACNGKVTSLSQSHKSESESYNKLKSDKGGEKALLKLAGFQKELADCFESFLGDQWVNDAGKWVNRIRSNAGKCERVIAEVRSAVVESRIKTTRAQYAEQIWKEFA